MPAPRPISVRFGDRDLRIIEAGAENARTNLSDYIRRKCIEGAEIDLLQRSIVTIPAANWDKFEAWANKPAKRVKGLRELAKTRLAWRD